MVAVLLTATLSLPSSFHSTFPVLASQPTTPPEPEPVTWMYCRMPANSATMIEEYDAGSVMSVLRQTTSPVFLFSAARVPLDPPGEQIKRSPSISGDSL